MSATASSYQTPEIPPQVPTPSHEWAKDAVGAVQGAAQAATGDAPKDRGRIPGSFPESHTSQDKNEIVNSAKESLARSQENAQGVYDSVGKNVSQTAQSVYTSAEQAARQYLPQGVVDKLEQVGVLGVQTEESESSHRPHSHPADARPAEFASLPTHETGPFHPTHGGVGTLPGQPTEAGVAKLPDERVEELRDELPTHETGPFQPTHGGVGSLPGDKEEVGVALLPDEKVPAKESKESATYTSGFTNRTDETPPTIGKGVGEVGAAPEERMRNKLEENDQRLRQTSGPGAGSSSNDKKDTANVLKEKSNKNICTLSTVPGKPPSHQPNLNEASKLPEAAPTTSTADVSRDPVPGTGEPLQSAAATTSSPPKSADTASRESDTLKHGQHSKVGFGTKMKAQAKILSGKITNNEGRVEEGKAMKQGAL